jgi:signal transduction histidine kinase/CheY-like chemotaxis protein
MENTTNDKIVMVLDDEPGILQLCKRVLDNAGYEVITLHDSRQAAGVLQQTRIDLLLVDIRMPKMDGFQVMELARKYQPEVAVVMMTGYGTLETATKALRMGANGLVLKPFDDVTELVESVSRALEDRAYKKEMARLQALDPLINISSEIFSAMQQDSLVDIILDSICKNLACEHAGYYVRETNENGESEIKLVGARGTPLDGEPLAFEGGPLAQVDINSAEMRVNVDAPDDSRFREIVKSHQLATILVAPAQRGSNGNSVLLAGRGEGGNMFSDADLDMFQIMAQQAGVALENARLYSDLRASLQQLQDQQRALIQAEKMAAIGRTTASIAHEVNNPLQAVRNCLHLATHDDLDPKKRAEYLDLAQTELERLMDTMKQMLEFYRPSAVEREYVDVNLLLETVDLLLQKQLKENDVVVEYELDQTIPQVLAVKNQIQQVFFNMLLNAMEAMPDGGEIFVKTFSSGRYVEILFEDTGIGVPDEERVSIFEPFMSTKDQGTGLGLSVSYSILEAHGGTLELLNGEQARHPGACFRIELPILEATT